MTDLQNSTTPPRLDDRLGGVCYLSYSLLPNNSAMACSRRFWVEHAAFGLGSGGGYHEDVSIAACVAWRREARF